MDILIDNLIRIKEDDLRSLVPVFEEKFTYSNPMYYKKKAMNLYVSEKDRTIKTYNLKNGWLLLPRGAITLVTEILKSFQKEYTIIDNRISVPADIQYTGDLTSELSLLQDGYSTKLAAHSQRLFIAPPSMGKTRTMLQLMSKIKQQTMVVVHTSEILKHWLEEASLYTNQKHIGQIGIGKKTVYPITIAMIQTLYQFEQEDWDDINTKFGCVIVSECFLGSSEVYLGDGKSATIQDIVEKQTIKEVMSYNTSSGVYEKKKIVTYMKTPTINKFVNLKFKYNDNIISITCTDNHKFFTNNRGYVQAKDLTKDDSLKFIDHNIQRQYVCGKCGKMFQSSSALGGHCVTAHNPSCQGTKSVNQWNSLSDIEKKDKITDMVSKRDTTTWRHNLSLSRLGGKNPMHKDSVIKRIKSDNPNITAKQLDKAYHNHLMKCNPLLTRTPTSLEKVIINMEINDLIYTGAGKHWVTKGSVNANPDFKVKGQKKVIEIGDTEYWHNDIDIEERKLHYQSCGYKCLYLTDKDVKKYSSEQLKDIVNHFIYNHEIKLLSTRHVARVPKFQYNIEVEDNHNYIVNGVLVKNCQHSPAPVFTEAVNRFKSKYRYGETASLTRKDGREFLMFDCISRKTIELPEEELHNIKRVLPVDVKMINTSHFQNQTDDWVTLMSRVTEHDERNNFIVTEIKNDVDADHYVVVLTDRKQHCLTLQEKLKEMQVDSIVLISDVKFKERKIRIQSVKDGKIKVIIATTGLLSEGANIPILSCLHLVTPSNNFELTKQKVGRIRRLCEGKQMPLVKDYVDIKSDFLYNMAKNRRKYYNKLKFSVTESVAL